MFDLEAGIRSWRDRQQRTSSLSMRELDELEDHLRARVDLELELNAALAPARAFAIAHDELGTSSALAREFAKAGKPRWRKLLVAGWAMFTASFFLPVINGLSSAAPWSLNVSVDLWGWDAFLGTLTWAETPFEFLSPLTNVLMLVTFMKLRGARPPKARWLAPVMTGAVLLNLGWVGGVLWGPSGWMLNVGIGYWTWVASFGCVASALWMRAREWAPAKPKTSGRVSSQGVFE